MNIYYLFDGHNELGPFELSELKQQKLTRTTPIRMRDTDKWISAEKLPELKTTIINKRLKQAALMLPAVREKVNRFHSRRPKVLSASLLIVFPLLAGVTVYKSITVMNAKPVKQEETVSTPVTMQASMVNSNTTAQKSSLNLDTAKFASATQAKVANLAPAKIAKAIKKESLVQDPAKKARLQWRNLFTIANSNYGIGVMGGIKDLSVIINNQSDYMLDEVVAKITYVKANGEVWKSKLVTLHAIGPHSNRKELVADVNRSKKAVVVLEKLISKTMHFKYTASSNTYGDDPYLLK